MTKALIFLAAGIAMGLLLAPEKGSKLRKQLFGKFEDMANDTTDFVNDAASNVIAKEKHLAAETEDLLAST
jgi:gas vesicle protein